MKGRLSALLAVFAAMLALSGCTAMLLGGGGGYEPPRDTCEGDDRDDERCRQ